MTDVPCTRLRGKVALVTGAASGIGLAVARRLAAEGACVVLSDVQEALGQSATELLHSAGAEAAFVTADSGEPQDLARLVEQTLATFGGIDICVPCAGVAHVPMPFHQLDIAIYQRVMQVNLNGPFLLGQMVAQHMIATKRRGSIVHVSSVGGQLAVPEVPAYCISKAGLDMLTKVMAVTLAPHGIRVNGVAPGATQTPLTAARHGSEQASAMMRSRTPLGRYAEADEMAAPVAFLASDDSSYITGQTICADGGRTVLNYTMNAVNP